MQNYMKYKLVGWLKLPLHNKNDVLLQSLLFFNNITEFKDNALTATRIQHQKRVFLHYIFSYLPPFFVKFLIRFLSFLKGRHL